MTFLLRSQAVWGVMVEAPWAVVLAEALQAEKAGPRLEFMFIPVRMHLCPS